MANTIKLKTGSGSDPSASDLIVGEIAIRTDSGKLFTKKDNGSVAEISGGGGIDDGDKGDITVSNGGDTFTIDSGVIDNANIASNAAIAGSKISPAFTSDITGTGGLTLTSTDASAGAEPIIELYRNSASPNDADYLGSLKFTGESDDDSKETYAKLTGKIDDASSGTEDGLIEFMLKKAGSNNIGARLTSTDLKLINGTGLEVAGGSVLLGNGGASVQWGDTSSLGQLSFTATNGNPIVRAVTGKALVFQVDMNTTAMTLLSNGNVSIGADIVVGGTVDGVDIAARDTLFGGLTSSSGVLTNGVTATTQSASDNSTKVATTAYTDTAISNLVNSAPSTLDTLNELAAALGDDPNFATTVTNSIATKLPLAGGTLTGNLTISNATPTIIFTDDDQNPDFRIRCNAGQLGFQDVTAGNVNRLKINSDGHIDIDGNLDVGAGLDVTGNITVTGTVDGRDVATDGTKLDGIESNATADQSKSDIDALGIAASTATTLATARTIAGVSFDGSANISLNNNAITNGAGYITATLTNEQVQDIVGGMLTGNTETGITVTYQDGDGTIDFVVGTLNQDTTGNAATATALETARNIGGVSFDGTGNINLPGVNTSGSQDTSGNAATATKLATARTIAGVSFDGSANISLNNNAITNGAGYLTSVGTSNIADDAITGAKIADDAVGTVHIAAQSIGTTEIAPDAVTYAKIQNVSATNRILGRDSSGAGVIEEITPANLRTMINVEDGATADQSASEIKTAYESNSDTNAFTDALLSKLNGIAASATNVTNNNQLTNGAGYITATLTNEQVQDIVGGMVSGNTETGITVTYQDSDGTLDFTVGTLNQDTTGNAATATALETARTIGGVSFNGTANINLPGVNTAGNQNTSGNADTATTSTRVTVTDNSSDTSCFVLFTQAATGNQLPHSGSNLTFNASSGLLTATGFAGALTGNVTGNASGSSGSCTGNAATATALETARTIAGVSFDGSANISLNNNAITNGAGYLTSSSTLSSSNLSGALPAIDGSNLTGISAGATGGGSDEVFYENDQAVTTNYTITNGKNAMAAGPITINSGVTVTVGSGETLTIV